jgi:integrase/recombinase XerD
VANDENDVQRFYKHLLSVRSKRTAESYASAAERFEQYLHEGKISLEEAPPGIFDGFVEYMSDQGLGPASIRLISIGAKKYVDFLRKIGRPVPKEMDKPELPKIAKIPIQALNTRQLQAFLAVTDKYTLEPSRTILKLLPFCGLRVSEITSLKLSNVTRKDGTIHFAFTGKGNKYREVPLEEFGEKVLTNYLSGPRQKSEDREFLFAEGVGKHISTRTIQSSVKSVREALKIDFLTPHTLRKTYATMLVDKGVPLSTVMNLLGHASMDTSLQHYIEVKDQNRIEAVGRLVGGKNV